MYLTENVVLPRTLMELNIGQYILFVFFVYILFGLSGHVSWVNYREKVNMLSILATYTSIIFLKCTFLKEAKNIIFNKKNLSLNSKSVLFCKCHSESV